MIDFMNSTRQESIDVRIGLVDNAGRRSRPVAGCSTVNDLLGWSSPPKPNAKTPHVAATERGRGFWTDCARETKSTFESTPCSRRRWTTPSDVTIDDQGNIALPLVGRIKAAGLTPSELAENIQSNYVPRYYVRCTATVLVAQRFFYVGGEVHNPGRFLWSEDTTLLKAINTAAGFTDYANRRKVQLARGKQQQEFDCEQLQRNPAKDVPIRPGDTITVPRSVF